MAVVLRSIQNT